LFAAKKGANQSKQWNLITWPNFCVSRKIKTITSTRNNEHVANQKSRWEVKIYANEKPTFLKGAPHQGLKMTKVANFLILWLFYSPKNMAFLNSESLSNGFFLNTWFRFLTIIGSIKTRDIPASGPWITLSSKGLFPLVFHRNFPH